MMSFRCCFIAGRDRTVAVLFPSYSRLIPRIPQGGPSGIPVSIQVMISATSVRARKGPRKGIFP